MTRVAGSLSRCSVVIVLDAGAVFAGGGAGEELTVQPKAAAPQTPRMFYADPTGVDTKDPCVVRLGKQYFMYYSVAAHPAVGGHPAVGFWTVGVATSTNLRDWTFAKHLVPETEAERKGFCAPGAIVLGGKVHLFYQSYGSGPRDAILHAVSEDGLAFKRTEGHVFRPKGDWTSGRAIDAEAFVVGETLHLYWATRDAASEIQMVGVAAAPLSSDFGADKWTQLTTKLEEILRPTVPTRDDDPTLDLAWEQKCIEAPSLLKHKGRYYMFYAGAYNNAPQQIAAAVSEDGVRFRRLNRGQPILRAGAKGSWNAAESGHPGVFQDTDGKDYLFFQGDNPAGGIRWHLSMMPIRWREVAGGVDVPELVVEETK